MGTKGIEKYQYFLSKLDAQLESYFKNQAEYVCCKRGCSACCEKGDYPVSELELKYLMQGFSSLDNELKKIVQNNFSNMEKGGQCPFLIKSNCSIYPYRPIICRVHGLAYLYKDKLVKVPYCANNELNYKEVYKNGEFLSEPIQENLDTQNLLKDFDYGEIRNLYDWLILKD